MLSLPILDKQRAASPKGYQCQSNSTSELCWLFGWRGNLFVIFNQHSCHTFQNGYFENSIGTDWRPTQGTFHRISTFGSGEYYCESLFACFVSRFARSPAFLFKISANEFFLFDEVSGLCNSLNTLLVVLQDNIFWSCPSRNRARFASKPCSVQIRLGPNNIFLTRLVACINYLSFRVFLCVVEECLPE